MARALPARPRTADQEGPRAIELLRHKAEKPATKRTMIPAEIKWPGELDLEPASLDFS